MNNGQKPSKIQQYWFWSILFVGLIVIVLTFQDYGLTWDETPQSIYGELVLKYFKSGGADKACNSFIDTKYYGPLFELITATIYQYKDEFRFEIRHLCIALTALLSLAGLMKYSRLFSNRHVVVFASLSLITLPRFYGHSFNNSKDIPFTCSVVWAMFAIALLFHKDRLSWFRTLFTGITIGLALSVRSGGFLLFFYLAAIFVMYCVIHKQFSADTIEKSLLLQIPTIWHGLLIISTAWIVMIGAWPWAIEDPILNPIRAFKMLNAFHATYPVFFEGKRILSDQLPRYYLSKYLLITTPPLILFFFCLGVIKSILKQIKNDTPKESLLYFITQLWFFFPILYFTIKRPNVYDGIRHFLFILPAMAVFAGIGASAFLTVFPKRYQRSVGALLVGILIIVSTINLTSLHPYQMTYFNFIAGGIKTASKKYDTDYWVSSYKEAIEWVNCRIHPRGENTVVLLAANSYCRQAGEYYKAPHISTNTVFKQIHIDLLPPEIDYYISTTRYGLHKNFPNTPVVHRIGRGGGVFTVVKSNHKIN